ncbi:MAG: cyclic nucleotide-binding domain-containing protein [Candidatus Wallbacteria bacterium]|nr:cyclic nucleotide-binding domain-containing protein [Candidatus Wallbacteria bacterium]
MYIVLSGEIDIFSIDTVKRKHLINTLGEGEFFGEMSLIEEKGRAAGAEAKGDARLIFLGRDAFLQLQTSQPAVLNRILLRMMREMSNRLRMLGQRYVTSKAAIDSFSGF